MAMVKTTSVSLTDKIKTTDLVKEMDKTETSVKVAINKVVSMDNKDQINNKEMETLLVATLPTETNKVDLIEMVKAHKDKDQKMDHLFRQEQTDLSHLLQHQQKAVLFWLHNQKETLETKTNKEETLTKPRKSVLEQEQICQNKTTFLLWMKTVLKKQQWVLENS